MNIPGRELSACLFPHSHASEREIKSILSFFDTLTIFQPWHIETHFSMPPEWGLKILRPPEHLRPIEGFPSLLSEYKNWMGQCKDRGYASALSAIREYGKEHDCTWDIRRSIRGLDKEKDQSQTSATQYHLLLHLARETEERLREAGEVLTVLKEKGSPLRDAMMDEEAQGVLNDLSDFEPEREVDEEFIEMVFDAWHGLFSGLFDRNAGLVTFSRPVFETLSELWSEYRSEESDEGILRFCWPDLSRLDTLEFHLKKGEMETHERMREFKGALQGVMRNPAGQMKVLSGLAQGLELNSAGEGKEMLGFRLRMFGADPGPGLRKKNLNALAGKFLFLLEESCRG